MNISKLKPVVIVASLGLLLTGCTTWSELNLEPEETAPPEVIERDADAQGMNPELMVSIFESGNSLTGQTTSPEPGEYYFWSPDDDNYSSDGVYSVIYEELDENGFIMCNEDRGVVGSFRTIVDNTDFTTTFEVSFEGSCVNFQSDAVFEWMPAGNGGRYEVAISSVDEKETTEPYVTALQEYMDKMASENPESEEAPNLDE